MRLPTRVPTRRAEWFHNVYFAGEYNIRPSHELGHLLLCEPRFILHPTFGLREPFSQRLSREEWLQLEARVFDIEFLLTSWWAGTLGGVTVPPQGCNVDHWWRRHTPSHALRVRNTVDYARVSGTYLSRRDVEQALFPNFDAFPDVRYLWRAVQVRRAKQRLHLVTTHNAEHSCALRWGHHEALGTP